MPSRPLRFVRAGRVQTLYDVPPTRTLLQLLREDLQASGTKEGCGEGDCGACTVVLAEARQGRLHYQSVNSCIRLAHSIDGMALWTVEDLAAADGTLHPVQQALVDAHGSQCGFCTPGFAMSLFGIYQNHSRHGQRQSRAELSQALAGNLCRCTGYRPILDAAEAMQTLPAPPLDEADLLSKLEQINEYPCGLEADLTYEMPRTLEHLLTLRAAHPQAQLVAGCTDAGLWVSKGQQQWPQVLDLTRVAELRRVEHAEGVLRLGAAVTLSEAFAALEAQRPQLAPFTRRFAGPAVRNSGTLGGNIANGSPIGDSMPLLLALGASLVLARLQDGQLLQRELPLEDFYTGYRRSVLGADEVLAAIHVPAPGAGELLRAYKVSKRHEDDISAVCLVLCLQLDGGTVRQARLGVGGVAATPVRARQTEAALCGQPWNARTVQQAQALLQSEFNPLSDLRASRHYRQEMLAQLLQRFWLESQGDTATDLQTLEPLTP